jgi:hypothetical protein
MIFNVTGGLIQYDSRSIVGNGDICTFRVGTMKPISKHVTFGFHKFLGIT